MSGWVRQVQEGDLAAGREPQGTWKRYVGGEGRGLIFGLGRLEPGEAVVHAHDEEEVFYVLSGHGEAEWSEDGTTHRAELVPGAAFFKSSRVSHTLRCVGSQPMLGLYCKA